MGAPTRSGYELSSEVVFFVRMSRFIYSVLFRLLADSTVLLFWFSGLAAVGEISDYFFVFLSDVFCAGRFSVRRAVR